MAGPLSLIPCPCLAYGLWPVTCGKIQNETRSSEAQLVRTLWHPASIPLGREQWSFPETLHHLLCSTRAVQKLSNFISGTGSLQVTPEGTMDGCHQGPAPHTVTRSSHSVGGVQWSTALESPRLGMCPSGRRRSPPRSGRCHVYFLQPTDLRGFLISGTW